jgi:pimeloyl-ACP methyl ester carboxylesterase
MANVVLVHGSFCGGWYWCFVAPKLRKLGHDVYTPTLTGLGDRSHVQCNVDLNTHIKDITNLLFYEDLSKVTLVGHSYAGMVITGVAAKMPERISKLIYLDAYVPLDGQSEVDLWPQDSQSPMFKRPSQEGQLRQPPPPSVFGINDPEMVDWIAARLTPQPMGTYTQAGPDSNNESRTIPRAFIQCTIGSGVAIMSPFVERAKVEGWEMRQITSEHDPMITHPDELTMILNGLIENKIKSELS